MRRVALAGLLLVVGAAGCGGGGGGQAKSTAPAKRTGPAKVGDTLTFPGVDYGLKVLEAKKAYTSGSGQSQVSAKAGNILVIVRVSETGKTKKSKIVLVDGRGRTWTAGLITFTISAEGKTSESTFTYGVPVGSAHGSKLRVKVRGHVRTVELGLS